MNKSPINGLSADEKQNKIKELLKPFPNFTRTIKQNSDLKNIVIQERKKFGESLDQLELEFFVSLIENYFAQTSKSPNKDEEISNILYETLKDDLFGVQLPAFEKYAKPEKLPEYLLEYVYYLNHKYEAEKTSYKELKFRIYGKSEKKFHQQTKQTEQTLSQDDVKPQTAIPQAANQFQTEPNNNTVNMVQREDVIDNLRAGPKISTANALPQIRLASNINRVYHHQDNRDCQNQKLFALACGHNCYQCFNKSKTLYGFSFF